MHYMLATLLGSLRSNAMSKQRFVFLCQRSSHTAIYYWNEHSVKGSNNNSQFLLTFCLKCHSLEFVYNYGHDNNSLSCNAKQSFLPLYSH